MLRWNVFKAANTNLRYKVVSLAITASGKLFISLLTEPSQLVRIGNYTSSLHTYLPPPTHPDVISASPSFAITRMKTEVEHRMYNKMMDVRLMH